MKIRKKKTTAKPVVEVEIKQPWERQFIAGKPVEFFLHQSTSRIFVGANGWVEGMAQPRLYCPFDKKVYIFRFRIEGKVFDLRFEDIYPSKVTACEQAVDYLKYGGMTL